MLKNAGNNSTFLIPGGKRVLAGEHQFKILNRSTTQKKIVNHITVLIHRALTEDTFPRII